MSGPGPNPSTAGAEIPPTFENMTDREFRQWFGAAWLCGLWHSWSTLSRCQALSLKLDTLADLSTFSLTKDYVGWMVHQIKDIRQMLATVDGRLRRMPYPVGDPAGPPVPTPARILTRSRSSSGSRSGSEGSSARRTARRMQQESSRASNQ